MTIPSAGTAPSLRPAVIGIEPLDTWDHSAMARMRLEGVETTAALRTSTQLTTPDGLPTLMITLPGGSIVGQVVLHVTSQIPLQAGRSYELSLLCRSTDPVQVGIAGLSSDPPVTLTRFWNELLFPFTLPAAGPALIPGLRFVDQASASSLHLGRIGLRERREIAPLDGQWTLFLHATPPAAAHDLPNSLEGPRGRVLPQTVSFVDGTVDLAALAPQVQERDSAVFYRRFVSPIDGIMRLGVSADWYWELLGNGKVVSSRLQTGNQSGRFIPQDHLVEVPVRCGSNLLAIQVLAGSKGWRLVLGALGVTQRIASPKGTLISGEFRQSRIYPGTMRSYWVYVPAQYDPTRPACLHVSQDGHHALFTDTMDELIDAQEMPVTVGLFINSGVYDAPSEAAAGRGNRCYEYDSLGDDYARFLLEEMIPHVARTHQLQLSDSGNDRSIGGCSSGGICAFNAAWERPDAFRRVYTNSGSFVAFRGGNQLPALIRKYEAKPLRVYTHVAVQDMENSGGNWWFANQEFERALAFSGYDYQYRWSGGGHGDRYLDAFPEAMRWLWRDHPAPITASPGPPRIRDILIPDEPWRRVDLGHGGRQVHATSVSANAQGEVIVCDAAANQLYQIALDGKTRLLQRDAGLVCALTHGSDGQLAGVSPSTGRVMAFARDGGSQVLAAGVPGSALVATRGGGFYVVGQELGAGRVWRVDPDGTSRIVDTGLRSATAVAISIDGWMLYVADGASHFVYAYRIHADGSLSNKERLVWLHVPDADDDSGAAGVACAAPANLLLITTRMGIQTSDRDGHNQCIIPSPHGRMHGLCLGGPAFDVLHVCCDGGVYTRKLQLTGHHAFHEPRKPHGGAL